MHNSMTATTDRSASPSAEPSSSPHCDVTANRCQLMDEPPSSSSISTLCDRLSRCALLADHRCASPNPQDPFMAIEDNIDMVAYRDEGQLGDIMGMMALSLSEPYSIYTYRYFIHNWPQLCFLAVDTRHNTYCGAIVCKVDGEEENLTRQGYIAMLAVTDDYKRRRVGSRLVLSAIDGMRRAMCHEVVLETECNNASALGLYERLGFVREKRLYRYYLNGGDAYRLKLYFRPPPPSCNS